MQRVAGLLALTLTVASLVGCAYDPYTGTYVPCCGYYGSPYYGNPYYRYPPPYAPYGYPSAPYAAPQSSQPGAYAPPAGQPLPEPHAPPQQSQPGNYPPPQQIQPGNYPPPGQRPPEPDAAASPSDGEPAQRFAAVDALAESRVFAFQRRAEHVPAGRSGIPQPAA
jgi:hypothetical protein